MVSIGTVLSLVVGGAVIAGGIAVFSNLDRIGGAFTRGVEESITRPFSDYLDDLFKGNGASTQSNQSSIAGETIQQIGATIGIPTDSTVNADGTVSSSTPPLLTLENNRRQIALDELEKNRFKTEQENREFDRIQLHKGSGTGFTGGQEGFYYFNVVGSKYDNQQFLSREAAQKLLGADPNILFNEEGLTDIKFLGKSRLGDAGFRLFGESQGYL